MHHAAEHESAPPEENALLARFPLVPRARPSARALPIRIDEVHRLATEPPSETGQDHLGRVVQALNKAALVASDCGLSDRARDLCWRQFAVLSDAGPLPPRIAQYALEPIVNLGRLATRRGDSRAYELYETTFCAVTAGTAANIDGRDVDFGHLVRHVDDRRALRRFLWTILLAEGTRALVTADRWDELLPHLERYNGVGDRMLDGRQAAVLSHAVHGHTEQALALVDATGVAEPWERAVGACLRTLCLRFAGRVSDDAVNVMIDAFYALSPSPLTAVFHTRLGMCVADLAETASPEASRQIIEKLVRFAVQSGDGRAAVDLHAHCAASTYRVDDRSTLTHIIEISGMKHTAPQASISALVNAAEHALTTLSNLLHYTTE